MKSLGDSRRLWVLLAGGALLLPAASGIGPVGLAMFQVPAPAQIGTTDPPPTGRDRLPSSTAIGTLQYKGVPVPDAQITIEPEPSSDPDATYKWTQTEGPPVDLENAVGPKLQLTIPRDAHKLGFNLTIQDKLGTRRANVAIPVRAAVAPAASGPRADAGDDQIGLVGRKITLNGAGSMPRGRIAYRWLMLEGAKIDQPSQDGSYFAFTPEKPGIYRFGLVVASVESGQVQVSDVDEVTVTVAEFPWASVAGVGSPVPTAAIDQMLKGPGGQAGRATLEQAAASFDAIAGRATLYTNFAELSSELMRRLDAIIPADPNWRQFWSQAVFAPLSEHLAGEMLASGVDLRTPQGQQQALGPKQQERIQKIFTLYAREFRSRSRNR
jgi:hypothetical protein